MKSYSDVIFFLSVCVTVIKPSIQCVTLDNDRGRLTRGWAVCVLIREDLSAQSHASDSFITKCELTAATLRATEYLSESSDQLQAPVYYTVYVISQRRRSKTTMNLPSRQLPLNTLISQLHCPSNASMVRKQAYRYRHMVLNDPPSIFYESTITTATNSTIDRKVRMNYFSACINNVLGYDLHVFSDHVFITMINALFTLINSSYQMSPITLYV